MLALLYSVQNPTHTLVRAVLMHDWAEQWTGDVPAPAKWGSPILRDGLDAASDTFLAQHNVVEDMLSPEDRWMLDWLDITELNAFCQAEFSMGNVIIQPVWLNGLKRMAELMNSPIVSSFDGEVQKRLEVIADSVGKYM